MQGTIRNAAGGEPGRLPPNHPLRAELYHEPHARPFPVVRAPVHAVHLVLLSEPGAGHHAQLGRLASAFGLAPPPPNAASWYADVPGFTLRWERHTEFCTYTFLRPADDRPPFACAPLEVLPAGWLESLPGELLVATQVAVLAGPPPDPFSDTLRGLFDGQMLIGSRIVDDRAVAWTTLKLHADGFSRYLVYNTGLNDFQTGRTLQRLLEIETYRTMALLGYPEAKRIWPRVRRLDTDLAGIIDRLAHADGPAAEQQLLKELSVISQAIEHMRSDTNYRFSATRAYMALMHRRLEDLREQKYPGRSSMHKFLERRMTPALDTCDSVDAHLQDLSLRVARATEALRARIETTIEEQNRSMLDSLNRRSLQQLRLQQTVEGLSVAAISYYVVGLLNYGLKGLAHAGAPLPVDSVTALLVVPVALSVWWLVRWHRRRIL
ncbi:MAG: DUF3422 family protein [Gammaproteobacteria bacterium]